LVYEPFARKYRPKDFESVVGQKHVVNTLKNAIKLNRVSHGYIFAGPRGVGKTTIARIITKSLNCKEGITEKPCGKCENCIEIDKGSFPDMYEIDAASNRGIDDIRALKDNVNYAPIKGRYKVYIIDEAHMLTREAFNALLKTLEEPPPKNIFILATTELHKIPDTIRSRTQIFMFRPIKENEIKEYLKHILEKEKIPYEEDALELIANYSHGGVRDSASILDQVVTYSNANVTLKAAQEILGIIPENIVKNFLQKLKERNIKELVILIEKLYKEGYDLNVFWKQMLDQLHKNLIEVSTEGKNEIFEEKDVKYLIYLQSIFNKAYIEAKTFPSEKNIYELAVLKIKYIKDLENNTYTSSLQENKTEIENKNQTTQKVEDNSTDLQTIIMKIGKEAGNLVSSALKKSKFEILDSGVKIKVPELIYDTVVEKKDVIEKHFQKSVEIVKIEIPQKSSEKKKERDKTVDKVLELFEGKIINYKEE
jgi:DNA polymerase-3 subunit gamma/tau